MSNKKVSRKKVLTILANVYDEYGIDPLSRLALQQAYRKIKKL